MKRIIIFILLLLISCKTKENSVDDRYIIFNVYSYKYVYPHSIILNFKDKNYMDT